MLLNYGGQPETGLYAVNARDGSLKWKAPLKPSGSPLLASQAAPGEYYALPVAANGCVYFSSRNGVVTVLEAGDE